MADIYELMLALDLRDDVSEAEVAELRWHVGLGPRPEGLNIVTGSSLVMEVEGEEVEVEEVPEPLLSCQGEAYKVGGALFSVLLRKEDAWRSGWALTSRQEIHPDDFDRTGTLLTWLADRAHDVHRRPDGGVNVGWTRFYEEVRPEPLVVRDGVVVWPS
ncbi:MULTISPECIES: hypothetical protein [unclassified Streptomyces]|uniref:hypothetical protein n=1 Tax=Streptomyces sp. NBRC 14336 TaxID=3030992 RepID=UPI002553A700|nr:hypothetical protein [Streptomyces sp. NBRC 14336]WBO82672.1 hypothetical protein SBE_006311 [Streptomyces sp. SBE_14.2]